MTLKINCSFTQLLIDCCLTLDGRPKQVYKQYIMTVTNMSLMDISLDCLYQVRVITVFTVCRLLTDFVCLIVTTSVVLGTDYIGSYKFNYHAITTAPSMQYNFQQIPTSSVLKSGRWWCLFSLLQIRVITKLPNSEQSYKGKVKTHKYINSQNQSTTGKL
jgi:hypothetical protein